MQNQTVPCTYLNSLIPLKIQEVLESVVEKVASADRIPQETGQALSNVIQDSEDLIEDKEYEKAKRLFQTAVVLANMNSSRLDIYLTHRLVFSTCKSAQPDHISSLYESMSLLQTINLAHTNDPKSVSMAGAIEKKLYGFGEGDSHLDDSLLYFLESYYTLNHRYRCINLSLTYVYRSTSGLATSDIERMADLVMAKRIWSKVLNLCERDWAVTLEKGGNDSKRLNDGTKKDHELQDYYNAQKLWISGNRADAYFGLGQFDEFSKSLELPKKTSSTVDVGKLYSST